MLVQEPIMSVLPEGVRVVACKVPTGRVSFVRVMVHNASAKDIVLKKKQVIADVYRMGDEYALDKVRSALKAEVANEPDTVTRVGGI